MKISGNDSLEKTFTRRTLFLSALQSICGFSLIGRLYYLSAWRGENYKDLAEKNYLRVNFNAPKRGNIYDRNGVKLAYNVQTYRLMVVCNQVKNITHAIERAQELFELEDEEVALLKDSLLYRPKFIPTLVRDGLTWKEVCAIETKLYEAPGFYIDIGWRRIYTQNKLYTHTLGYVRAPNKAERSKNKVYRLTDLRVGQSGVERYYNDHLEGDAGFERLEVNAKGRTVRTLQKQDAVSGHDLKVTLDHELQSYAAKCVEHEKSASIVVMNIESGHVLAMVSHPSFDVDLFARPISQERWKELSDNPYGIMHNKTVHGLYPPGSIFKMSVVLAGLEMGYAPHRFRSHCQGYVEVGGHRFHCWHKLGGHGRVDYVRALRESCDVFFYELAMRVGPEKIAAAAESLGFGAITGVEIQGEKAGVISTPTKLLDQKKKIWRLGDTLNMGIGQGAMLATPIQLCTMMARLAGQGSFVAPTLNSQNHAQSGPSKIAPIHLQVIQKGLEETVNHPAGLAYRHRISEPTLAMAGKTATCQVRRITMAERKKGVFTNGQRPWIHRDHALFTGYAPIKNPRFAVSVVVEHGGSGGTIAAPIGRNVLYYAQTRRPYQG